MDTNLLLTWDQYQRKNVTAPYVFEIQKGNRYLLYFGAKHVFDPVHPQFNQIQKYWEDFLKKTQRKNCFVLVEGSKREITDNTENDIRQGGEGDFITHLAIQDGIEVECPEPSFSATMDELIKRFPKEEVYYMKFASIVLQWHKLSPQLDFEEYASFFLKEHHRELGWNDFDFSLEHMKIIHQRLFQKTFSIPDQQFFYSIVAPTEQVSIINGISRAEDLIRDSYIVDQIQQLWNQGSNLFVVFGVGHAVVQEPALRKLLT